MNLKIVLSCVTAVVLSAVAGAADVLYVDINDPNASDETCEGRGTEALPYKSIQAAVSAAEADWTVLVKPGVYTNNYALAPYSARQKNRVLLEKTLRLESTGGATVTEIRGKFSDSYETGGSMVGYGDRAVRCLLATAEAEGSVIKGFTFGCGATQNDKTSEDHGGGVCALANVYVVDCSFTNCWGKCGGALDGGTAIRSYFTDNNSGSWDVGTVDNAKVWNCIVRETKYPDSGYRTTAGSTFVNCTLVASGYLAPRNCSFQNCIVRPSAAFIDDNNTYVNSPFGDGATLMSAFTGDYRLPTGSAFAGQGDTSKILSLFTVPDEFKATDFAGNAIDYDSETCDLGAIQGTYEPICGAFKDTGAALDVDGWTVPAGVNFRPATYPSQMCVKGAAGKVLAALGSGDYWPMSDGTFRLLAPPNPTEVIQTWSTGASVCWVDDENGSDEAGKGTEAEPYKTIQKAWEKHSGSYVVINVKPGVYDEGGAVCSDGVWARVTPDMVGGGVILIRATEGPERTFLVGATGEADECRIAYKVNGSAAFQGFTVTGARTTGKHGDAVSYGCAYVDCVISNCVGATTLIGAPFAIERTRVVGNSCAGEMLTGSYSLYFSQFYGNRASSLLSTAGNPVALSCTFSGNVTPEGQPHVGYQVLFLNNSIVDANGCEFPVYERSEMSANYLWNYVRYASAGTTSPNFIIEDPRLADALSGDERLLADSPAWTRGSFEWKTCSKLSSYARTQGDIGGRPLKFNADGSMPMGCNQYDAAAFVEIAAGQGGLDVEGVSEGLTLVAAGESRTITVSAGSGASRKILGFVARTSAGSTTHLFADEATWTHTVDSPETSVSVSPLYDNNWYVDATNGSDANDGFTPGTAKKTLADVVTNTVILSGDVIHAAPGVYNEGQMRGPDHSLTYSRVVLPAGVSLVATEGRDVTFIEGADAPEGAATKASDGCGTDATRCLYLMGGCRVEGFTLRKGRGYEHWESGGTIPRDYSGAGVYVNSSDLKTSYVVNCLVTDCKTGTGAGAYGAVCLRCVFRNNARSGGNVISNVKLVNSLCIGSDEGATAADNCEIYGSTLRPSGGYASINASSITCYNSVIIGQNVASAHYYGCVFATNAPYTVWGTSTYVKQDNCTDCQFGTINELKLGTDLVLTEESTALIDRGFAQYLPEASEDSKWDVVGAPRVMNRRVDLGAYEWDIRPDLAADLGRKATVGFVTANVVENGGTVLMEGDGARLEATLAARTGQSRGQAVTVTGTGVLKVYLNGTLVAEKGVGTWDIVFENLAALNALVYAVEGDATAEFAGTKSLEGMLLILR